LGSRFGIRLGKILKNPLDTDEEMSIIR